MLAGEWSPLKKLGLLANYGRLSKTLILPPLAADLESSQLETYALGNTVATSSHTNDQGYSARTCLYLF